MPGDEATLDAVHVFVGLVSAAALTALIASRLKVPSSVALVLRERD